MQTFHKMAVLVALAIAVAAVLVFKPSFDTDDAAHAVAADRLPRLVDLGATSCVPCRMMAPILDELREKFAGQFDVHFIDVWQNPDAGAPYRMRVIPTQIFFDAKGKELYRHEGFYSRAQILDKWQELGFTFGADAEHAPGAAK